MEELSSSRRARLRVWQHRASLRTRLAGFFIAGSIVIVVVVALSAASFAKLLDARHTALDEIDPATAAANQLFVAYLNQETGVRGYALTSDQAFLSPYGLGQKQQGPAARRLNRLLANRPALLEEAHRAESVANTWQQTFVAPTLKAVTTSGVANTSTPALLRSKRLFDAIRAHIAALDSGLDAERHKDDRNLHNATELLIVLLLVTLGAILATAVALSRLLQVWVQQPLRSIATDARAVRDGELAHPIVETGPRDFRELAIDVEAMRGSLVAAFGAAEQAHATLAQRNVDLARSNIELEQFAYVASHDLQEPLRKVTSFVQLLQKRYGGQLDETADQYIELAVDGAKRMQQLIHDLLAFSRVGRTTEQFVEVDLGITVRSALKNLATVLEETGATVEVGELPTLTGDPGLFAALWQNLIGNALKFRSDAVPIVRIDAVRAGGEWTIGVADNGIGIEPRFAEKVFVLFQRLHSREEYEGTGIGLALAKKIVEFHGGRIWLDPDYVGGTRICLTLPAERPEVRR